MDKKTIVRNQADPLGSRKAIQLHTCRDHDELVATLHRVEANVERILEILENGHGDK